MTRVAICGGAELRSACLVLGLEETRSAPRLVLVDLRSADEALRAAAFSPDIQRIVVASPEQASVVAAIGGDRVLVAATADPADLGPLVARALPRAVPERTRVITVTAARGGTGRTLCAANLGRRLAADRTVMTVDATGTGALGWWLGADARPWSELEALAAELRAEHVELVATSVTSRLSVVGGAPAVPTAEVLATTIGAARELADIVLVDAPLLGDERARAASIRSDRTLVFSYADAASRAILAAAHVPASVWIIGSQGPLAGAFRTLPRDERSVGDALRDRARIGGALGRAYDELAELLAIDAT